MSTSSQCETISQSETISILDTGDFYILAFGPTEVAIDLYAQMDIQIITKETDMKVNADTKAFIKSNIARIIPYYNNSSILLGPQQYGDIVTKLENDVRGIINFHKITRFWSSYTQDTKDATAGPGDVCGVWKSSAIVGVENMCSIDTFAETILPSDFVNPKSSRALVETAKPKLHIIFNNMYNVALVVKAVDIDSTITEFPEFKLIETFDLDDTMMQSLESICELFFHKKTFENSHNLVEKLKSLKQIYNIIPSQEPPEKEKVIKFMKDMYIMSNDANHKIGALELYNTVANHLCVPWADRMTFRKRLAGYFLDLGLIRKRYSDGYYYYGIQLKNQDQKKTGNIHIDDIISKRNADKRSWCESPSFLLQKI